MGNQSGAAATCVAKRLRIDLTQGVVSCRVPYQALCLAIIPCIDVMGEQQSLVMMMLATRNLPRCTAWHSSSCLSDNSTGTVWLADQP